MSKRQRTAQPAVRRSRRPIDKKLTNVVASNVVAGQVAIDLYGAATFPGTITGLRWSLGYSASGLTGYSQVRWAIVVVPQNTNASTLSIGSGTSMYDPEQMVLAFGSWGTHGPADSWSSEGQTKSMRKLKARDKLQFIVYGTNLQPITVAGTVQFFYKT